MNQMDDSYKNNNSNQIRILIRINRLFFEFIEELKSVLNSRLAVENQSIPFIVIFIHAAKKKNWRKSLPLPFNLNLNLLVRS